MPISSPFHPFSCHCNLTKLDRCCQNQLHDSTSFCLKFTLPLYHKWSISIVLTLPDLQIFFFWKLCYLVTFNLRAIKKNRRGLQSPLEKNKKYVRTAIIKCGGMKNKVFIYATKSFFMYVIYRTIT